MKDNPLDLSLLIEQHKKEIWAFKMKESEWVKTKNQLDGNKRIIEEMSSQIQDLRKRNSEVENEMAILKGIGNNSPEMKELKRDNKYLAEQVSHYRDILKKAGF
jgi:methyl-accepting chemotaxis protein|tara:strand:- start:355 stop:666 length:312 start_codon:yes stop_codon:yes gene_type:complete